MLRRPRGHGCARWITIFLPDALTSTHRDTIVALTKRHRLPATYPLRIFSAAGGLQPRTIAILANAGSRGAMLEMVDIKAIARTVALEVVTSEIRRVEDIAPSFKSLTGRADALYVGPDALVTTNSIRINLLAVGARLPTTYVFREDVAAGGRAACSYFTRRTAAVGLASLAQGLPYSQQPT